MDFIVYDSQCRKGPYAICRQCRPQSACAFAQADQDLCSPLRESMDTVVYVHKQRLSRSHRADAQASGSLLLAYGIRVLFPILGIIIQLDKVLSQITV